MDRMLYNQAMKIRGTIEFDDIKRDFLASGVKVKQDEIEIEFIDADEKGKARAFMKAAFPKKMAETMAKQMLSKSADANNL